METPKDLSIQLQLKECECTEHSIPDPDAKRRALRAAQRRRQVQQKALTLTPEQAEERRRRRNELERKRRRLRKLALTPEQLEAEKKARKERKERKNMETPKDLLIHLQAKRRALRTAQRRKQKQQKLLTLTPEQAEEQRRRRNELARKRRRLRKLALTPFDTIEQLEAEKKARKERIRKNRAKKFEIKTEESLQGDVITKEIWNEKKAAIRRAKKAEYQKNRRHKLAAKLTPEELSAQRAKNAERQTYLRHRKRLQDTTSAVKQGSNDNDLNESCTWLSLGSSEGSCSIFTAEGAFSVSLRTEEDYKITKTDEHSLADQNSDPEEKIAIKDEFSQNSWSCFEASKSIIAAQQQVKNNSAFGSLKDESQDLDYKPPTIYEAPVKEQIQPDIHVVQGIIVKEELDL